MRHATFTLAGQQFMCIDSSVRHGFTFTPSISLYVSCETEPARGLKLRDRPHVGHRGRA